MSSLNLTSICSENSAYADVQAIPPRDHNIPFCILSVRLNPTGQEVPAQSSLSHKTCVRLIGRSAVLDFASRQTDCTRNWCGVVADISISLSKLRHLDSFPLNTRTPVETSFWNLAIELQRKRFSFEPVTVPELLGLLIKIGGLAGLELNYGCYELGFACWCEGGRG